MTDINTYHLIAYDIEAGREAFDWPNCADVSRPLAGQTIERAGCNWEIVGISGTSTLDVHRIDVRKVK